ncbi:MAG TPA: ElyC/SanA/YdcF family protein [Fibrobacteria bacterium]|nr:ElyC/SanA/YdcF family protein [Fibrobacteria bacterium]
MPIRPRTPPRSARVGFWRHWTLWVWFALALVFSLGGVALWKSGRWLVREDRFDKVHWGVVLAGESRDCERSDAAIRMFHDGKIDTLVISATRIFKNRYSSEFLVDYYAQQGVPRDRVFEFRQDAYSTLEEARLLVRQFRLQNLDTVLIVTSSYHTARTRRIFRKLAQGYPVVLVAAAEYHVYDPNAWWSNREGMKTWVNEWAKTVFTWFELAKTPPENGKAEFQGLTPDVWSSRTPGEAPDPSAVPASDTASPPPIDSAAQAPGAAAPGADSGRESAADPAEAGSEAKQDAKAQSDSALAKADSAKARKDSLKTAADRSPAEAKSSAKDPVKKALPKAEKKPVEKKAEKTKGKKKG